MNITNINNRSAIEQQPNSSESTPIKPLPNEIIENILVNLDAKKIGQARRVCKRFLQVIDDDQGKCSLKIKVERYKKLYSESHKQANNIVVDNYQQRFNQWYQSLSITEFNNSYNIIKWFGIHGQYYNIAKLVSYDNKYTFQEIKQFKIEDESEECLFYDFHVTNDQNICFFTITDDYFVFIYMLDNRSEKTLNRRPFVAKIGIRGGYFRKENFLLIDDFIAYVPQDTYIGVLQKKIDGIYTDVTDPLFINNQCGYISYLGKKDGNVNFLIQINTSFYVLEENKLAYSLNDTENNYWKATKIFNNHSYSRLVVTAENGLVFIIEEYEEYTYRTAQSYKNYVHDPNKQIHIYKYTEKIASISLTDEEKQGQYFFGENFACNNQGTSFTIEKFNEAKDSYLSVYAIQDNKIELVYNTRHNSSIETILKVKYSPCGNFIEVEYLELEAEPKITGFIFTKNIYSLLDKKKCLETFSFTSAFNSTGFLYATETVTEDKKTITIYSCKNQQIQIKTIINCTNTVSNIKFSPNSQFVAAMELNSDNQVQAIKVYQIFKLQQDDTVEFAPINQELPTEVFTEIKAENIINFKFHPDGFKIIVITKKAIKTFCLIKKE